MAKATSGDGAPARKRRKRPGTAAPGIVQTIAAGGAMGGKRPAGRSLADFRPLHPAEQKIIDSCAWGGSADIGEIRPREETADNIVRAAFLRFVLLGGDDEALVHESGVSVCGAWIQDNVDLIGCIVAQASFSNCTFQQPILARFASFAGLNIHKCAIVGFHADWSSFSGLFFFHDSLCAGRISLRGAKISRDVSFSGSRIYNKNGSTLSLNGVEFGGGLSLRYGFRSRGRVEIVESSIKGALLFEGGTFVNRNEVALMINGTTVGAIIALSKGFRSIGEVQVFKTHIHGDAYFGGCTLINPGKFALHMRSVAVDGGLVWREVKDIRGSVSFDASKVADLVDDWASWEKADDLILDGFRYDRIQGGHSPTDADIRIKWLRRQKPEAFGAKFWPQPWEQLVKVLRDMGHLEDAKRVAIGKQLAMREAGVIGQRPVDGVRGWRKVANRSMNLVYRALHWTYGVLAGFGHRPLKTVAWMAFVWLACGAAFMMGADAGLIGPTNSSVYAQQSLEHCGFGNNGVGTPWTRCEAMPPEYSPLDPFVYSLDVILPLLDLKQENEWRPIVRDAQGNGLLFGHAVRFLMWFEILFGWVTSLLLVSALGKLVQKD